jgi:hypothetical protein
MERPLGRENTPSPTSGVGDLRCLGKNPVIL